MRMCRRVAAFAAPIAVLMAASLPSLFAGEFRLGEFVFTVPNGFVIERAAMPPVTERPIAADFDDDGRLYVAESSGASYSVRKQLEDLPHRIVRLEDTDGDGRFDRRTLFADRMMFPEGALWHNGALYVAAPPSIWKLVDEDGDGKCDRREEWFRRTLSGCANDLHGPYLGLDGWIYWCKGEYRTQSYDRPGRDPLVTRAAHIFRARVDGSDIEPVMTGGMNNPVDVVFTPEGERILSTTFLQRPGGGKRDGLIHAIYGGVYGKVHSSTEGHQRTSDDVMPVLSHLGAAAPCGMTRYNAPQFGAEYENNLFVCNFNMKRVTRHVLKPDGSSFLSDDSDFVTCDHWDFHPTDVVVDADGSLLVVDTGGWYKVCCPTSQLSKPDVLGGIYRVRRVGAEVPEDPRGLELTWDVDNAPAFLADARPAVRQRARSRLAQIGASAVPALAAVVVGDAQIDARRNAVWTLSRIPGDAARKAARLAFGDLDRGVRHAAAHVAGVWRDARALPELLGVLNSDAVSLQRVAAEAIGRIGRSEAVAELLAACETADRGLEHSLTYALIEIDAREATARGLASEHPRVQRAALVAVDQMDSGGWEAADVIPFLQADDPSLRSAAAWIVRRHPQWGGALAGHFEAQLQALNPDASESESIELLEQLVALSRHSALDDVLARAIEGDGSAGRHVALKVVSRARRKEAPASWAAAVAGEIRRRDPSSLALACAAAQNVASASSQELNQALSELARDVSQAHEFRLAALAAIPKDERQLDSSAVTFLMANVASEQPINQRSLASRVLSESSVDKPALDVVVGSISRTGPLEINRLFAVFDAVASEELGIQLLAALRASTAFPSLRADALEKWLAKQPEAVREAGEELVRALRGDAESQRSRIEEVAALASSGDARRGQRVFKSEKAACVSCHSIGYLGGTLGPDLTNVGSRRSDIDLAEAIMYPNLSFVQSYEPVTVVTKSGEVLTGILHGEPTDEVVLRTGPVDEVRLAREDAVDIAPSAVSLMPSGLDAQLTAQELADLVAFLKVAR